MNKNTFNSFSKLIKNLIFMPEDKIAKFTLLGYDAYKIGYTDEAEYYISNILKNNEILNTKKANTGQEGLAFGTMYG